MNTDESGHSKESNQWVKNIDEGNKNEKDMKFAITKYLVGAAAKRDYVENMIY